MSTFYDYGRWSVELSRSIAGRYGPGVLTRNQPGRSRKPGALAPASPLSRPGVI